MPLYYFHCRDAHDHASNTYGVDRPDLASARSVAIAGAIAMMADAVSEDGLPVIVEIDDEDGRPLLSVPVAITLN